MIHLRRFAALWLWCLLPASMLGGENEALALAVQDLRTLPLSEQHLIRYVWITDNDPESVQATALVMNYISLNAVIARPVAVTAGKGRDMATVMRISLKDHYDADRDLNNAVATWEELRFDPRFNHLFTQKTLEVAAELGIVLPQQFKTEDMLVDVPPFVHTDGKTYNQRWTKKKVSVKGGDIDLIRVVSEHIDKELLAELIDRTRSQAPVVNHRYFGTRATGTIRDFDKELETDNRIFAELYGGLYYRFTNTPGDSKEGTDEDNLLERLKVGNVKAGVTARKLFATGASDKRIAVFDSKVTGKPRQIQFLPTLASIEEQAIYVVTGDVRRRDIDPADHPINNLLNFEAFAKEAIYSKENGLIGIALFNGKGKRQDAAPSSVVGDRSVPNPHSTDLHGLISCLRCHGPQRGWQFVTNDVAAMSEEDFGVLIDLSSLKTRGIPSRQDLVRIRALYKGDMEQLVLPRARDTLARAVLRATDTWKASKKAQLDVVELSSAKIAAIYDDYNYRKITAQMALAEWGIEAEEKDAAATLRKVMPRIGNVEDAVFIALTAKRPLTVTRPAMDFFYSFGAVRIQRARQAAGGKFAQPRERK